MKKSTNPFFCLLILTAFVSCNTDTIEKQKLQIDSLISRTNYLENVSRNLMSENEKLQRWVTSYQEENRLKKYAYVLIRYSGTELRPIDREYYRIEVNKITWSPIREYKSFNDNIKYQFMDEIENSLRDSFDYKQLQDRKINSVECFVFNSYAEASQDLSLKK